MFENVHSSHVGLTQKEMAEKIQWLCIKSCRIWQYRDGPSTSTVCPVWTSSKISTKFYCFCVDGIRLVGTNQLGHILMHLRAVEIVLNTAWSQRGKQVYLPTRSKSVYLSTRSERVYHSEIPINVWEIMIYTACTGQPIRLILTTIKQFWSIIKTLLNFVGWTIKKRKECQNYMEWRHTNWKQRLNWLYIMIYRNCYQVID